MKTIHFILALLIANTACSQQKASSSNNIEKKETASAKTMKTLYDFKVKDINGQEFDMASLKGKKVMIVNTASECGLTPQYENLEKLYKEYGGDKFTIIGFPCNDFGAQEPGTNEEIKTFCSKNYGVTFRIMDKVKVLGNDKCELYKWLTSKEQNGVEESVVKWNFQKYLIDENGNFVKMVSPKTLPDDASIIDWIKG
jgi:glutathione peroxidase